MTAIFVTVAAFSTLVAGLCVPAFLIWVMGVPGVAGSFLDGWKIGLLVLVTYPISYIAVYLPAFIVWMLHNSGKVSNLFHLRWQQGTTLVAIYILARAAFRMSEAFRVMSSQ